MTSPGSPILLAVALAITPTTTRSAGGHPRPELLAAAQSPRSASVNARHVYCRTQPVAATPGLCCREWAFVERLAAAGAARGVGTVGDALDNPWPSPRSGQKMAIPVTDTVGNTK
jgi:hypothetical protein